MPVIKGQLYLLCKRENDEALAENMAVLGKNPKYTNAAYNIAVIYHRTDRLDKAMEWYDKITKKIDPLYEDAYYNRAQLYSMKGDHSKAYSDYISYSYITKWRTGKDPAVVYNQDEIKGDVPASNTNIERPNDGSGNRAKIKIT